MFSDMAGMRVAGVAAAAATLMICHANFAWGDVVISTAQTQNMSCSGGVCAPTSNSAILNVTDLENLLASGAVEVTSTGSGVEANDIDVTSPLSWSASSALALNAHRAIAISATIASAGTSGIALTARGGTSGLAFDGGNITFANTSSSLTIGGKSYALVDSIAQLASAVAANPAGRYALANGYDAGQDGTYTTDPVPTALSGTLEGLGNAIQNFSMADSTDEYAGLFAQVSRGGLIRDLVMSNASISAGNTSEDFNAAAAIVGLNEGSVLHSSVAGSMTGLAGGNPYLGPLVGRNEGKVSGSSANVSVSNLEFSPAGGLVGVNDGDVSDSYATGNVKGQGGDDYLGGLVGENDGYIVGSYATGSVSAGGSGKVYYVEIGGLAGDNGGWIYRSHATGRVRSAVVSSSSNTYYAGGLVGTNEGLISGSYETGSVDSSYAPNAAGGLVGQSQYGTGSFPRITDCYATGATEGSAEYTGGLIGLAYSGVDITNSYATGKVKGRTGGYAGGFVGSDSTNHGIRISYWDTTSSGKTRGTGNRGNEAGLRGMTTSKFQSALPRGFSTKLWAEDPDINNGFPYLIANPPPE